MDHFAKPRRAARSGSGWYEALARVGLVAKGVSYGIVGVLALGVAAGAGGEATSRQGALKQLAGSTFGAVLLVLLALGFAAYALWRFVQAAATSENDEKKQWGKRAGYVGRGLIYASLAFSAAKILAGAGGGQSQNGKAHKTTAVVLSWPGGTWLVGIAGAAIVGVGAWNFYRGITEKFEEEGRTRGSRRPRRACSRLRADRQLRDQGGRRLQPERRGRARRRAAEACASELRALPARPHRRRSRRVHGLLPRRRALPRRLRVTRLTEALRTPNRGLTAEGDGQRIRCSRLEVTRCAPRSFSQQ